MYSKSLCKKMTLQKNQNVKASSGRLGLVGHKGLIFSTSTSAVITAACLTYIYLSFFLSFYGLSCSGRLGLTLFVDLQIFLTAKRDSWWNNLRYLNKVKQVIRSGQAFTSLNNDVAYFPLFLMSSSSLERAYSVK